MKRAIGLTVSVAALALLPASGALASPGQGGGDPGNVQDDGQEVTGPQQNEGQGQEGSDGDRVRPERGDRLPRGARRHRLRGRITTFKVARRLCKNERDTIGNEAFLAKYGDHARRACLRAHRNEARAMIRSAVEQCRAAGDQDQAAFVDNFGRRHAMRRCVRDVLANALGIELGEKRNAARQCRAEHRELGREAFRAKYGTNDNGRNAFGQCVRSHVGNDKGAEDQSQSSEPKEGQEGSSDGPGEPGSTV